MLYTGGQRFYRAALNVTCNASAVAPSEKSLLTLIGSPLRAFQ